MWNKLKSMKTADSFKNSIGVFTETYRALQKSNDPSQNLTQLKMEWAQSILARFNMDLSIKGQVSVEPSVLYVGNHISYMDIPVLMSSVPDISFVAKKEISSWPLFGKAAKRMDTVFVQREAGTSRTLAKQSIREALKNGSRIAIFPAGTTCVSESKTWRRGAFEIAYGAGAWVQPFKLSYQPLRTVAYIDDDTFLTHLFKLSGFEKIQAEIEFHEPVKIKDPIKDCLYWNYWARGISLV